MAKTLEELVAFANTKPDERQLANELTKFLQANPPDGSTIQTVYQKQVRLTNDEIKALPSTYIELVPAPGAGKLLLFQRAVVRFTGQSAFVFDNLHNDHGLFIAYGNWDAEASTNTTLFNQQADSTSLLSQLVLEDGRAAWPTWTKDWINIWDTSTIVNKPFKLIANNQTNGNFTGGNGATTMSVTVTYSIVDL